MYAFYQCFYLAGFPALCVNVSIRVLLPRSVSCCGVRLAAAHCANQLISSQASSQFLLGLAPGTAVIYSAGGGGGGGGNSGGGNTLISAIVKTALLN